MKNFMISELVGLPRDKIKVIRHGIGTDAYDELSAGAADVRHRFGIADDEIMVGAAARLVRQKSLHVLLAAFGQFHARSPCGSKLLM